MFVKLFRSVVSFLTVIAFLNALQIPDVRAQDSNSVGGFLGGIVAGALGVKPYSSTPEFKNIIAPWVKDKVAFDALMTKYRYRTNLSEKENVDLIIQLAVLKYAPNWLSPKTLAGIDKYYPGLRQRKTKFETPSSVALAFNDYPLIASDATPRRTIVVQQTVGATAAPTPVLELPAGMTAAADFAEVINAIGALGLVFSLSGDSLTPQGQQALGNAKQAGCAKGIGTCVPAESVDIDISGMSENCKEQWAEARQICTNELRKRSPSRGMTGGYTDINKCMKGFVSHECGGNKI